MIISEGLHEDDLDGVLIPVVSVDEYLGKIDDNSIVVSFFLTDPDASVELSSFIESGPFEILDSDISQSINEDGYYQVFVEMERTREFYDNLRTILDAVNSLTKDHDWKFMTPRTKGDAFELTPKALDQYLTHSGPVSQEPSPEKEKHDDVAEAIMEYLSNSNATNVKIAGQALIFENHRLHAAHELVTLSDTCLIYHVLDLHNKTPNNDSRIVEAVENISRILGENWDIDAVGKFIVVSNKQNPYKTLLLK